MSHSESHSVFQSRLTWLALAPLSIYWVFCLAGVIQFHLWSQVVNLWELDYSLVERLGYAHGLRFTLVYPIFEIAQWLGISYDRLVSIIAPPLLLTITYFSARSVAAIGPTLSREREAAVFVGISLVLIALSLFMNGRLFFAFAGSSILMWALLNWENNRDPINFCSVTIAIYLSSVSSGTLLIVVFSFYFFLVVNLVIRNPSICRRGILLSYALLLVVITPFLSMFVIKNLDFYGGGFSAIFNMLGHGYGLIILQSNLLIIISIVILATGAFYFYRNLIRRHWILVSLVMIYLAGGMFGYSTALVVLPPLLVIASRISLGMLDKVHGNGANAVS
jgi:hypothetical protein